MSITRRKMRMEMRAKQDAVGGTLKQTVTEGVNAEKFILSMLTKFEEQYNHFLSSPDNRTVAEGVKFQMDISRTSVAEADLKLSPAVPTELFKHALRDVNDPTKIQIMYLRIDKITTLKDNHGLVARPGAVEQIAGNFLTNLLYHAAVILQHPAGNAQMDPSKFEELETAAAKRRLTDDLITCLFINGIQYQESANERQWQLEHKMQLSKVKEKANEVDQLFKEAAANMKVAN